MCVRCNVRYEAQRDKETRDSSSAKQPADVRKEKQNERTGDFVNVSGSKDVTIFWAPNLLDLLCKQFSGMNSSTSRVIDETPGAGRGPSPKPKRSRVQEVGDDLRNGGVVSTASLDAVKKVAVRRTTSLLSSTRPTDDTETERLGVCFSISSP